MHCLPSRSFGVAGGFAKGWFAEVRKYYLKVIREDRLQLGLRVWEQEEEQEALGVEAATGSLGHGLPIALGMALAARIQRRPSRQFVLMSDGECEEGSVWEAAMFAPAQKLDSVIVMVDYNKWQATGRSDEIMALAPLAEKWRAFGWDACEVDGHDMAAVLAAISREPDGSGRPRVIVAHTVKGKGVSFMEDDNNWHYRIPTADEVRKARVELGQPEVRA